jgi:hypothetical protein
MEHRKDMVEKEVESYEKRRAFQEEKVINMLIRVNYH